MDLLTVTIGVATLVEATIRTYVVFCNQDEVSGTGDPSAYADALFGVERPRLTEKVNLAFHGESRRVGALDIELMGPLARQRREQETLAEWAHQLQHAVALAQ